MSLIGGHAGGGVYLLAKHDIRVEGSGTINASGAGGIGALVRNGGEEVAVPAE